MVGNKSRYTEELLKDQRAGSIGAYVRSVGEHGEPSASARRSAVKGISLHTPCREQASPLRLLCAFDVNSVASHRGP